VAALRGGTAVALQAFVEQKACDLVVMSTHGRGGLARLVLGSVAEALARQAPCPVLLVRRPQYSPTANGGKRDAREEQAIDDDRADLAPGRR